MTDPVIVVPKTPLGVTVTAPIGSPVQVGPTTLGPAGPQGPVGPQGHGIPVGGNDGDVVVKTGAADYEMGWETLTSFLVIEPNASVPAETEPGTIVLRRSV